MPGRRARAAPALAEDLPEQEAIDDLDLEFEGLEVIDFTDLELEFPQESFADELEELEKRFAGAAVGLPEIMPGEDGKMMELVPQDFIRRLMIWPPLSKPLPDWSVEALRRDTGMTDEEELETVAGAFRALQSARDTMNDIIRQYRAKGYAYVELPEN
jgi:hypothetical protein